VNDKLNIDASLNSAYVVIGLLYGEGDFAKTLEISTRCGQDSDCNPATAGGILGTVMGYDKIPEIWMSRCREVEDRNFSYIPISLNKVYDMSYRHALKVIARNGGRIDSDKVVINVQRPKPVRLEEGFKDLKFAGSVDGIDFNHSEPIEFDGVGLVIGSWYRGEKPNYVGDIEVIIDGKVVGRVKAPQVYRKRLPEIFCKYDLNRGHHKLQVKLLNPEGGDLHMGRISFYDKK
jgi:hypothetical protein